VSNAREEGGGSEQYVSTGACGGRGGRMSFAVERRSGASEGCVGRVAVMKSETWLLKLSKPHVRA